MKLGTRIKRLRNKKGLTQEQLASKICVTPRTIINYERGQSQPGLQNLKKIAKVLGVDTSYLTDEEENKISFKNWLKDYQYVPGTFHNTYFEDNTQKENDSDICKLINELKSLKHLPNEKSIGINTKKYIYKNCKSINEFIQDLKDEGEKVGVFLLDQKEDFCDIRFIFDEYQKYLDSLDDNKDVQKQSSKLFVMFDEMPELYHKLPGQSLYDPQKSEILNWLDKLPFESKVLMYEDYFMRARKRDVIVYDQNTGKWKKNIK